MKTDKRGTEEERAAMKAAAKERRRALLASEKSLDAVKRAEMLAAVGALRSVDGGALSPKNTILIALQAGAVGVSPSMVGGFKQWRDHGRMVRKGAKGLLICFPKFGKNEETETDEVSGFGWGYVFDISQTVARGDKDGAENEKEYKAAENAENENTENTKKEGSEEMKRKTETGPDLFGTVEAVKREAAQETPKTSIETAATAAASTGSDDCADILAAFCAA